MKRKALLVGINRYPCWRKSAIEYNHLEYASKDAQEFHQLLLNNSRWEVKALPEFDNGNEINYKGIVKQEKLQGEILQLFNPTNEPAPDLALLFFGGHGLPEGYLATSEHKNDRIRGVSFEWLLEELSRSKVKNKIVWLDCCYSGQFIDLARTKNIFRERNDNIFFLAASYNIDYCFKNYGVLTYLLLKALKDLQVKIIDSKNLDTFILNEFDKNEDLKKFPQRCPSYLEGNIEFWPSKNRGVDDSLDELTKKLAKLKETFKSHYLLDKYKIRGLEELENLTIAMENSSNQDNQNLADDVIIFLNGIIGKLPGSTELAKDCQEIIPLIRNFFGL